MPGVISSAEIIEINGQDHISGPALIALIETRICFATGKTKQYLYLARNLYYSIIQLSLVQDLKEVFLEEIKHNRAHLKKERIETFNIQLCEFTGTVFLDIADVEFAHIESVAVNPLRALDITNGVIILKSLHAELTQMNIHSFEKMYEYCQQRNYLTHWADKI